MSAELLVAQAALMEVGFPHLANAVTERDHRGIPFPTFAGSDYGFADGTLTPVERAAAAQAFMLAHQVHDRTAYLDDGGVECSVCDAALPPEHRP